MGLAWKKQSAIAGSVILGGWLSLKLVQLGSGDWWGAPKNLPYSPQLLGFAWVLGFGVSALSAVAGLLWISRVEGSPLRRWKWIPVASLVAGLYCAGAMFLLSNLPPWSRFSRANRAAHFCVDQLSLEWCEHLVRNYPDSVQRLPEGLRQSFLEAKNYENLKTLLEKAKSKL